MPRPTSIECPHCEQDIEHLAYRCNTSGYESGTTSLNMDDDSCEDSETTDSDEYEYFCPECDGEISRNLVERLMEEGTTEETEQTRNNNIIDQILNNARPQGLSTTMPSNLGMTNNKIQMIVCPDKNCKEAITISDKEIDDRSITCPICGKDFKFNSDDIIIV